MKRIITVFLTCSIGLYAYSQNFSDALRMSQYYAGGTARSVGMSGAFGALGGDLSVISYNPAGLGVYRGSEFSFTPAINFNKTTSLFDGRSNYQKDAKFIINNIGYAYTWHYNNSKGLQSLTFGIGYNRLSDFNSDYYIESPRAESSMLDEFVWNANHGKWSNYYEELAYQTYALDEDNSGEYYTDYKDAAGNYVYEEPLKRVGSTNGGIGEYAFSLGGNVSHMLYFGATLGIHDVYYEETYMHEEWPKRQYLDYYYFTEEFVTNGWGVNGKFGVIYKPIQMLRIGASIHTPTFYWLRSEFMTTMESSYNDSPTGDSNRYFAAQSDLGQAKYKVATPWRYNASVAGVIGELGLISIDAEYVDYSTASMFPNSDYAVDNDDISNTLKGALNLKGGLEARLGSFSLRAGAAYYGSPYEDDSYSDNGTMSYSAGVGYRGRGFYIDAGYSYTKYPSTWYKLYDRSDVTSVYSELTSISNKVAVTVGFKF